jgi:hypothetical protein
LVGFKADSVELLDHIRAKIGVDQMLTFGWAMIDRAQKEYVLFA